LFPLDLPNTNQIYLGSSVEFVDISTVALAGTVTIADTSKYNGGRGCAIAKAQVCAVNHFGGRENFVCTYTDAFGMVSFWSADCSFLQVLFLS
jgi:hypothetical protein